MKEKDDAIFEDIDVQKLPLLSTMSLSIVLRCGKNATNPAFLSFVSFEGEELDEGGDPPRIWSPFGEYPGTAFTRSMGDVIAEELGVSADPEIIRRKIHPLDRCER